ncbi:glycosyltransferase [Algirhabdus cladophorae]|uniref:glycosyltransferase n=1 Tax=Algirhabdus cladophorae TaxID=3377108 RepID=UPI003B84A7BD
MTVTTPTDDLAEIRYTTGISIIVPTYQEVDNIPHILARLDKLRQDYNLTLEVIFSDDNSQDGSAEAVAASGFDWAKILVRTKDRGLSPAVIEGFEAAQYPILVCMDCDLSHPPERIPQMILGLNSGQQFVIGSRYVPGASTDDDWGFLRWLNSIIATMLARPLTKVKDPMSGFFIMRKADFDTVKELNPVGYKIALELIVKCGFQNVGEVPIHFSDRVYGESKLSFKEQLKYIQHLRRLYLHRFANAMYLAQFLVVGASGVAVNLIMLSILLAMGLPDAVCLAGGIGVSVITNFLLNRRFTFSYAKDGNIGKQFVGFVGASAVGACVNFAVSYALRNSIFEGSGSGLYLSALCGIAAGMIFNYLGNRYIVFRKTHIRR